MPETVYVTLSIDPVKQICEIVGFDHDLAACAEHRTRTDAAYVKTFGLTESSGPEMFRWLLECGLTRRDATDTLRGVGQEIMDMMDGRSDTDAGSKMPGTEVSTEDARKGTREATGAFGKDEER